jgi:hypothetical protein
VQGKRGEGFWAERVGRIEPARKGICVYPSESVVEIKGTDDGETCDYCRLMWTKTGRENGFPLPPYHEKCRCYGVIED